MSQRTLGTLALVVAIVGMAAAMWAVGFAMPSGLGWVVAVLLVVLGGICATSFAGPNLAAVGVTPDDRLLVRPVGFMRFWALSRGVDVPVTAVSAVGSGLRAPTYPAS